MSREIPVIQGLPPHLATHWIDLQTSPQPPFQPGPLVQPGPPVVTPPPEGVSPIAGETEAADPIAGLWVTSNAQWVFTPDAEGYAMVERSYVGQTAQGRARLDGSTLRVDLVHVVTGRMHIDLALGNGVLRGGLSMLGVTVPFVLSRG